MPSTAGLQKSLTDFSRSTLCPPHLLDVSWIWFPGPILRFSEKGQVSAPKNSPLTGTDHLEFRCTVGSRLGLLTVWSLDQQDQIPVRSCC